MEKENYSQLELFSQPQGYTPQVKSHTSFMNNMRRHEKIILFIIGFMITALISFCIGVEKGKRIALKKSNFNFDIAANQLNTINQAKPKPMLTALPMPVKQTQLASAAAPISVNGQIQKFTIQVASYQAGEQAKKEAEALRKKGLTPFVFSKGKYTIVCIGNFANKQNAQSLLAELKKQYRDCFIRRL